MISLSNIWKALRHPTIINIAVAVLMIVAEALLSTTKQLEH